jgi:hypothetical protein
MIFEQRGQRERALGFLRQASEIAHANPTYGDPGSGDLGENGTLGPAVTMGAYSRWRGESAVCRRTSPYTHHFVEGDAPTPDP